MSIISIVWSSGKAYASIHKVHEQILSLMADKGEVHTWMLQGREEARGPGSRQPVYWRLSTRVLKGRGVWRPWQWWLQRRLAHSIERSNPKVLLLDGIGVARLIIPVVAGLHLSRLKIVVVFHGQSRIRRSDPLLLGTIPAHRLRLIAVSEALAESLCKELGGSVSAMRTAMNPYAFKQALISRDEARARLGIDHSCILLGGVGRLVEEKGYLPMLDALKALSCIRADLHLVLVGDGEQRSELEERIQFLELGPMVTLAGHREDVAKLYQAFDVMLIPSRSEGLGLVLQEAVMAHVPVVSSDLPVFVEQLGLSGVYVSPNDVLGWVAAIEQVLNSDLRMLANEQYRQLVPEDAWEQFCHGYAELLSDGSTVKAS